MRLCVSVLVAVILTVAPASAVDKCDNDQLEVTVGAVNTKTFKVTFTLENTGDDDVCILMWDTLLDPVYWPDALILEVKSAKVIGTANQWKEVPYDKPVYPIRLGLDRLEYTRIKRNSQVQLTHDLSDYFSFQKKKKYRVTVETIPWDCYKPDTPGRCSIANNIGNFHQFLVDNFKVTQPFTAAVSKSHAKVSIQRWLVDEKKPYKQSKSGEVIAFGATQKKLIIIEAAHSKVWEYFAKAIELLKGMPKDQDKLDIYKVWFGKYKAAKYKIVLKNFQVCLGEETKTHIYAVCPQNLCAPNVCAYVLKIFNGRKQHLINLCPKFFESSEEDQALILLHEMTHNNANTRDVRYGDELCYSEDACKKLARERSGWAIENAGNYNLFAKAAYEYFEDD